MDIEKLKAYFRLKGVNKEDNKLIQKEKIRYLGCRILTSLTRRSRYSLGEGLAKPVIADTSKGLFYCRKGSLDLHIVSESYEFGVKRVFEKLTKESGVIVDIGANIGGYTILAGVTNQNAKIYSIEPQKDNFKILTKNIKLNNLKNVESLNVALGNKKGVVKLYSPGDNNFGGYSLKNLAHRFELVQQNSFDSLFKSKEKEIDLIKIDVEGAETDVLKGMGFFLSNHKIKNIILEINDNNYQDIQHLLKKYGYNLKRLMYNNYLATKI